MDDVRRRSLAIARSQMLQAAIPDGREAMLLSLRRLRRQALREGDLEEAACCLSDLWRLSLLWPERQLRLARTRAKESPSSSSFVDLGHALAICRRMHAARQAYERSIEMVRPAESFDAEAAKVAAEAIVSIINGKPIPFVEAIRNQSASQEERLADAYEHSSRLVRAKPSASAFQELGFAHESLGRYKEALGAYKSALKFAAIEGDEALHQSLTSKVRILSKQLRSA